MNDLANQIAKQLSREIMYVWRELMSSDFAVNTKSNTTLEFTNLDVQAKVEENDFTFNLFYNHYLEYIEKGRKGYGKEKPRQPQHFVPIRPLIDWMKRNFISDDVRVAYAIRESIYQLGIPPRPLLQPFGNMLDKRFEEKLYDYIFNTITEKLDKYFNN